MARTFTEMFKEMFAFCLAFGTALAVVMGISGLLVYAASLYLPGVCL